jgi:putative ATP-dependent endonuclease of the OLD family
MRLRRVEIERFRGIKKLDWMVRGDFVCLVGPGDSTKTTILDAIECVLTPRWNLPFDDADFHEAETKEPIRVVVTVGDLPDDLKAESKWGHMARGWSPKGDLHDEPADTDELVVSIRLEVDDSLEPKWTIFNDREPEGRPISSKDREKLSCVRVGDFMDRHFSWGRGSILSRLTGDTDSIAATLAQAGRAARTVISNVDPQDLETLRKAASEAHRLGKAFGVAAKSDYRPHLDVDAISIGRGGLSLHEGEVPLRNSGLGTRRLLAVAMQCEGTNDRGLTLIDEVEHGLEPHRLRSVLRSLGAGKDSGKHVVMTTHAPIVLEELQATQLRVVRSTSGVTTVFDVPHELQPQVRKASAAFLARKVIVCEGVTELGFCRGLDQWWGESGSSFGHAGVALVDGRGCTQGPGTAEALSELGYDVLFLGDSDEPLNPDQAHLEAAGVKVKVWADACAIESRIAKDLPWAGVAELVTKAMALREEGVEASVRDAVASRLEVQPSSLQGSPEGWIAGGGSEAKVRDAVGRAAKEKSWFKRVDFAEELAALVIKHWDSVSDTDLGKKIVEIREWAHGQ